jgi:hypothetical protein
LQLHSTRRPRRAPRPNDLFVFDAEAGVVLVDVELAVEPEVLGVRPEKALDVRRRGQEVELLVLQGAKVLRPDLRALLELVEVESLAHARLFQAATDLEHGRPL